MRKRIVSLFLLLFLLADFAFIFYNSSLDSGSSSKISLDIADQLNEEYVKQQDELPAESFHSNPEKAELVRQSKKDQNRKKYNEFLRNLLHIAEFLAMTFLAVMLLNINLKKSLHFNLLIALLFGIVNAFGDEIHQIFVEGRTFQMVDIVLDCVGCMTGVLLGSAFFIITKSFILNQHKKN